jgi:hypothetical protein
MFELLLKQMTTKLTTACFFAATLGETCMLFDVTGQNIAQFNNCELFLL